MLETLKRLWNFSAKRRKKLTAALALSFLRSALGITQILAVILAVRVVTGGLAAQRGIWGIAGLTVLCVAGGFVLSYFEQLNTLKAGMYTVADQRTAVARRLRRMPLGFFRQTEAEHIAATLTTTLQGVEMASTMTMVGIVSGLFNAAAMFLFMLWYDLPVGLIVGVGVVVYLLVVRWQMQSSRRDAPARQTAQTALSTAALTFLQGIRVTKAFCFSGGDDSLQQAVKDSCDANIRLTDRSMPSQFAAHLVIGVFESLLLVATVAGVVSQGRFGLEKAIVLLIFSFFAFASLDQAGSILSMIGMVESGLDEVADIQSAPLLSEGDGKAPEGQDIVLEHVDFSYGDRQVIRDVSACIRPNTMTAVIGPSGSGKTTLCRLIARFQDVNGGRITIGGEDVRNIPYDRLMEQISMVFQNVYLFEDTILNNIRFGRPDATLEEVRAAAKAARCDDFIMELPQGYETMVLEGGSSLSGGEKQRISIARAMLKDAPIIILDEATSALDAENERAFFDAVDELTRNRTVITIAHRLTTVERADQIQAIREGELVQQGSPARLREEPGLYADFLASRQAAKGWTLQN